MLSDYENAVQGTGDLYSYFGNRVVESKTTAGNLVAVKVKPLGAFVRSEADMMNYASQQPGILAPRVLGCYDVEPEVIATVTQLIPGQSLDKPYIGRINRQETFNFYDWLRFNFMGPFESEGEFDGWCLARVKSSMGNALWKRLLPWMRGQQGREEFVLTHGDLAARNIMVRDGKIAGIMDWEYMEYVLATEIHDCHEDWWLPVLKEVLEPCGLKRARFAADER